MNRSDTLKFLLTMPGISWVEFEGREADNWPRILTVENTAEVGKPIHLYDGAGKEVWMATWADRKTGEVEWFYYDSDGNKQNICEFRPLPLTIVLCPGGSNCPHPELE